MAHVHNDFCSTYEEFLDWLESLGAKLPEAASMLQGMIAYSIGFVSVFHPPKMSAEPTPTGELESKEKRVLSRITPKGAAGPSAMALSAAGPEKAAWDGTLLRQIFAFIQANPALVQLILSWLGVK